MSARCVWYVATLDTGSPPRSGRIRRTRGSPRASTHTWIYRKYGMSCHLRSTVAPLWNGPRLMYQGSLVILGVCRLWHLQVCAFVDDARHALVAVHGKAVQAPSPRRHALRHDLEKQILPTSFTLPDVDTVSSITYEPLFKPRTTSAFVQAAWEEGDESRTWSEPLALTPPPPPAVPFLLDLEPIPPPPTSSPCHRAAIAHAPLAAAPARIKLPPVTPTHHKAKRKCPYDQVTERNENIQRTVRVKEDDAFWSLACKTWPRSIEKRLCVCFGHGLECVWTATVSAHAHALERHYTAQRNARRNEWAQAQWEPQQAADVPDLETEYTQEVGRGEVNESYDVFPWTNLGDGQWEHEIDMAQDESISSANTSIIQQARWMSPRLSDLEWQRRPERVPDSACGQKPLRAAPVPHTAGPGDKTESQPALWELDPATKDFLLYMHVVRQSAPAQACITFEQLIPRHRDGPHIPAHACTPLMHSHSLAHPRACIDRALPCRAARTLC